MYRACGTVSLLIADLALILFLCSISLSSIPQSPKKAKEDASVPRNEEDVRAIHRHPVDPLNTETHLFTLKLSPMAQPLAGKKLNKKVHKIIKKCACLYIANPVAAFTETCNDDHLASRLRQAKRGVKEIVKAIRKGEKG